LKQKKKKKKIKLVDVKKQNKKITASLKSCTEILNNNLKLAASVHNQKLFRCVVAKKKKHRQKCMLITICVLFSIYRTNVSLQKSILFPKGH